MERDPEETMDEVEAKLSEGDESGEERAFLEGERAQPDRGEPEAPYGSEAADELT